MSKMAELSYDIEQLYIEGYNPYSISVQLSCPVELVYDWLASVSLAGVDVAETPQDEPYSPYLGA